MSSFIAVKSRKRSLTDSTIESNPVAQNNEKRQKTNQESVMTAYEDVSDKENDLSSSKIDAYRTKRNTKDEYEENTSPIGSIPTTVAEPVVNNGKFAPEKVSAHLKNKQYDVLPPPWQSRLPQILAERAASLFQDDEDFLSKHVFEHSDNSRLLTPPSETTGVRNLRAPAIDSGKTKPAPKRSIINGRIMTTASKTASKLQKTIAGYPAPEDPFPEYFTLTELCTYYPNHLFGENLLPFVQYNWSPSDMYHLLPSQDGVPEYRKVNAAGIASKLRKVKTALEKQGEYDDLMNGPRTHAEQ